MGSTSLIKVVTNEFTSRLTWLRAALISQYLWIPAFAGMTKGRHARAGGHPGFEFLVALSPNSKLNTENPKL
jgi:hypothetical protein